MKHITQFRYYKAGHPNNYPNYADYALQLTDRNIFGSYPSISHLGIQGPPGLVFYLNNSTSPLMIGKTGIYELDLEGIGRIFAIRFGEGSLNELVSKNDDARLIIDIVYDGG